MIGSMMTSAGRVASIRKIVRIRMNRDFVGLKMIIPIRSCLRGVSISIVLNFLSSGYLMRRKKR